MTLLSLLVPCYNASNYLDRLAKTFAEAALFSCEFLLVDDCSTDDTYDKALTLGLPIIQTPRNMGPGGARNYGVERLRGEWVHFLDADDILSAEVLRRSLLYLRDSIDVLLVGATWVDEISGARLSDWSFCLDDVEHDPLLYSLTSPIPTCCSVIRIDRFRAIGGFDSAFRCWEDGDLHLRLVVDGARLAVMDAVLTIAIRHDHGASSNHLYCHRCRLTFLTRYANQQLPIESVALANEFLMIGNLLLAESCYCEALLAYQLSHRTHPLQLASNQASLRSLMSFLSPPWALLLQQSLRHAFGRFFMDQK